MSLCVLDVLKNNLLKVGWQLEKYEELENIAHKGYTKIIFACLDKDDNIVVAKNKIIEKIAIINIVEEKKSSISRKLEVIKDINKVADRVGINVIVKRFAMNTEFINFLLNNDYVINTTKEIVINDYIRYCEFKRIINVPIKDTIIKDFDNYINTFEDASCDEEYLLADNEYKNIVTNKKYSIANMLFAYGYLTQVKKYLLTENEEYGSIYTKKIEELSLTIKEIEKLLNINFSNKPIEEGYYEEE